MNHENATHACIRFSTQQNNLGLGNHDPNTQEFQANVIYSMHDDKIETRITFQEKSSVHMKRVPTNFVHFNYIQNMK